MTRAELATKLISSRSGRERLQFLAGSGELADVALARLIKDLCYDAWTEEPTKAQHASAALSSLLKFRPDPEIQALHQWVSGIGDITKGRVESALNSLQNASAAFDRIGDEHESASPLVAMLIPLAMLGRYDEALVVGRKALRIFNKYGDELAAGKVEMNLSNIFSRRGLHRRSEKLGLAALERFTKIGETTWRTMAENDLANTYTELNDFGKAEDFYARALEGCRSASMLVTEAEIEASIGNLALFRGRHADALHYLELSRTKYDELAMPHQSAIADLEIARIYSELNLSSEALEIYRRVAAKLRKLKMRGEEARARAELGRTAVSTGDTASARRELLSAARLFEKEKNSSGTSGVLLMLAQIDLSANQFAAAADTLDKAERLIRSNIDIRQKLTADWLRAVLSFETGKLAQAKRRLMKLMSDAHRLEQLSIRQSASNLLGKIALRFNDPKIAEENFRRAIEMTEILRAPLPAEEFRIAFFSSQLEPYENLAGLFIEQGRFADAFECFEQARSRALVDAMLHGEVAPVGSGLLGERVATLREELNWYYSRSSRGEGDADHLTSEIAKREKVIADLVRRVGSMHGATTRIKRNGDSAVFLTELQQELGPERAYLEYIQTDSGFSLFVVTSTTIDFLPNIARTADVEPLLGGLRFQFDSFRYQSDVIAAFRSMLKTKTDKYLNQLFEKLIEPARELVGSRDVVITPVSLLHYLPFHAFRDGDEYLIEQRRVSYAPSATVWKQLSKPGITGDREALLLGYADENNPLVDAEVAELEKLFRKPTVLSGERATFEAYKRLAPSFDVLHFACHGQFRPDNPTFSSLHLADGWVTVKDICTQRLKASLVTLSACETGLNEIAEGEEIIGLARGFLSAGAAAIVLSLWTVNDAATAEIMKVFYQNLQRGETVAASLRFAQLKLIADGQHPFYWSPFMAIGK